MKIWTARLFIAIVAFFNLQCAVVFLLFPQSFSGGFELNGVQGQVMVRGMGILFLMWNVPYIVALTHPVRRLLSVWEAVVMQLIGVMGETLVYIFLPEGHAVLRATALRFIAFDGGGLVVLLAALWLTLSIVRRV